MARPDHWVKNAFMLLGVMVAFFYKPELFALESVPPLLLAFLSTCLVASSNYVLNELLDAPRDRLHPTKHTRPAANGLVKGWIALVVWGSLGLVGILYGFMVNAPFAGAALLLWVMGCAYNIPPVRTKDIPYLDVLSESINNPIRLLLGWYALIPDRLPPLSLALAYWMAGAYLMATKRFAEYRSIGDKERAAAYRASFRHYDESRLLGSMVFYVTAGALFAGIFIVRYKLELIFCVPFVAGLFAYYMVLGLKEDSPAQAPEKLHQERGFFLYTVGTLLLFVFLMYVQAPSLYSVFNVEPSNIEPLWKLGR
jgi:4-hydroxybenzoate polyprenyltransferase